MALYRCMSGGGGSLKETVLWTNPNTGAANSTINVTLSDDIDNYDFIKFSWKPQSSTPDSESMNILVTPSDLKKSTNATNQPSICLTTTAQARYVQYLTNTTLFINAAWNIHASGSNNNNAIPLSISGVRL